MENVLFNSDDYDDYQIEDKSNISDFCKVIRDYVKDADHILIIADKVNWRGTAGFKNILNVRRMSDIELFREIYPSYDCTFVIYKKDDNLMATVSSHDIPAGATWTFKGVAANEEE
jgi:hypothetical protein